MSNILIKNGNVILKDRVVDSATIAINDGKIAAISKKRLLRPFGPHNDEAMIIDAKGCFVSPGFIDTHIHGDPFKVFANEIEGGTTAFVCGLSCDSPDKIKEKIDNARNFRALSPFGSSLLGVRLEGPYINKKRCGAQNELFIHKPDRGELLNILKMCGELLKIMTIAPELKGAMRLISMLKKRRIIVSVGHSDATYDETLEGIKAGITHSTHTFNGMRGIDRREPGAAGAVLADERITAEVIMDSVHVHPALVRLILKAKGPDKAILITDSIKAEVPQGAKKAGVTYRFRDGTITGSSISMIDALESAVKDCGIPLLDAVRLITLNPARLLGVEGFKGSIAAGKDADIVVFDKNFNVKATIVRGRIVYKSVKVL